jgi:uncharacterized protein YkwD
MMFPRQPCAYLGLLAALTLGVSPQNLVSASTLTALSYSSPAEVIDAVNALRTSHGLPPYSVSSILMGTAQAQAEYMASTGSIVHTGPGGITVTSRLLAAGYPLAGDLSLGGFRSENIVGGYGMTAAEAVQSWTGDSIHLHTMLSTDLQEIGAGVAQAGGMTYYVIDCARPTGGGVPQAYTPGAESAYSAAINEIIVPVTMSTPDLNGDIVHVVQPGQSLWQIAIAYGVKIDNIRALNQLPQTYQIQPGDKLLITHVGTATALPATSTLTPSPSPTTAVPTLDIASATPTTPTPTPTAPASGSTLSGTGVAVGAIIITALIAAGLVAWAGRSRPV